MLDLQGRTAVVCGGTQGIGFAAARLLAHDGATVVIVARDPGRLAKARAELPTPVDQAHRTVTADFAEPELVRAAIQADLAAHAGAEILVNNTGGPPGGPITAATADEFLAAFKSHLIANHLLAQVMLPGMRHAGYGRIVNIVSTSVKQPLKGLGVSNTIRAAVAGWAKTLAMEVGPDGITVNNVLPGATRTGRLESIVANRAKSSGTAASEIERQMEAEIPMGRFGTPDEIAEAVRWLASPDASYVTGISLAVDGGRTSVL
ncbi:MAG: SDR family oxidoreductase [Gemmatimonadota bacterium]